MNLEELFGFQMTQDQMSETNEFQQEPSIWKKALDNQKIKKTLPDPEPETRKVPPMRIKVEKDIDYPYVSYHSIFT